MVNELSPPSRSGYCPVSAQARAIVSTNTSAAPASFNADAHAETVAPVVKPQAAATSKPAPKPAKPKTATQKATPSRTSPWVEPNAGGGCPKSHPIKAKMKSGIFHAPGGANYERTKPDRCYSDAAAAQADGLRPAKA